MLLVKILCFALLLVSVYGKIFDQPQAYRDSFYYGTFPDGFAWSTATSSYQIEGAWNESKGLNIWDTFTHSCCPIEGNTTGDTACDSYHKINEDIDAIKYLGVKYYRFSISWARIMKDGTNATINPEGIQYYKNLTNALLAEGITPMATLYHWDLPENLQVKYGGWPNDTLVGLFKEYARVCFRELPKVKIWLTFNEPYVVTWLGYGIGVFAPGVKDPGVSPYVAAHTIIKAHAEAYHLYQDEFNQDKSGKISITLNADWFEPLDRSNKADVEAAERAEQFMLGWYAHPIYVNGDYPEVMKKQMDKKLKINGKSRLPVFTDDEKKRINGTFDYFGLNHYTAFYTKHNDSGPSASGFDVDRDVLESRGKDWPRSGADWLYVVPWGFRNLLNWIKREYNDVDVYVTENGMSDRNDSSIAKEDDWRIFFYNGYINNMLKAIELDNVSVKGYAAWSLMDNFEWSRGYKERFGLFYVDFNDPQRKRVPKKSAAFYKMVVKDNGFPNPQMSSTSDPGMSGQKTTSASAALILFLLGILQINAY